MPYPYNSCYNQTSPYYPQQNIPMMQNNGYVCRPVTSREEAVAAQTDYLNSLVMPDIAHGTIYVKRFNPQTGASDFGEFKYAPTEQPKQADEYVSMAQFTEFTNSLQDELEQLRQHFKMTKGGSNE